MFTGIIETTGIITHIENKATNVTFTIQSSISNDLKIDQSVAHNGICLTVEKVTNGTHTLTAIQETIQKTNAGKWKVNDVINIERCLQANSRIDGHFVQGHVDATAKCTLKKDELGSWLFSFEFDEQFAPLLIEKGSVCINGTSLTCFNVTRNSFSVAIIPYTYTHTNIQFVEIGDAVNIEFDVFGKYMNRFYELMKTA
ncbi:MAG: riboflavin synthase [Chitinophagaceae bacterium]|jgi:riboflavin synthase|nr:riboflavin synthase [Chitinophagaceae bacterium]